VAELLVSCFLHFKVFFSSNLIPVFVKVEVDVFNLLFLVVIGLGVMLLE
jgi:hypothetical protein